MHRMAAEQGLVGEVLGDHRLAQAGGTDQDHIGGLGEEPEREQILNLLAVDVFWPVPVEVAHRLELGDLGVSDATFEAAALPLVVLAIEQDRDPGLVAEFVPASK